MSMTCIASHVPGRLRLRHPRLRSAVRNAEFVTVLAGWDGVTAAEGNPACGSIVLCYDLARMAPAVTEARIGAMFSVDEEASSEEGLSLWSLNRPAKIGMLTALAGTLIALSVGKKLHAVFGAVHVAFLLVHLANHRKKILQ
ncbi:MAG: hypothetical protein Q7R40_12835 [Phaeospirillum sp.]|nr:hypothetical protein [Phaeospirillum sp.]